MKNVKEIFIKIKSSVQIFLLGIIVGIIGCGIFYYKVVIKETPIEQSTVSTKNTSGVPLIIKKIFTKNKKAIETYLKEESIDFNKEESLKQILLFCSQLP